MARETILAVKNYFPYTSYGSIQMIENILM